MKFLKQLLLIAVVLMALPNVVFGQQLVLKNVLHDMEGPNSLLNTKKVIVTRSGNIAVATDGLVRIFDPTGRFVSKFGSYGHGVGQFGDLKHIVELSNKKWLIVTNTYQGGNGERAIIFDEVANSIQGIRTTNLGASGYCRAVYSRIDGQIGLLYDNGVLRYREDGTFVSFVAHSLDMNTFLQAGGTTRGEFVIANRLSTQIQFEIFSP